MKLNFRWTATWTHHHVTDWSLNAAAIAAWFVTYEIHLRRTSCHERKSSTPSSGRTQIDAQH